jgi:hypothetical protein
MQLESEDMLRRATLALACHPLLLYGKQVYFAKTKEKVLKSINLAITLGFRGTEIVHPIAYLTLE